MSYDFDGTTDFLNYTAPFTFGSSGSKMTMCAWVNTDAVGSTEYVTSFHTTTNADFAALTLDSTSGAVQIEAKNDRAATVPTDGVWAHHLGIHRASNDREAYWDGASNGNNTSFTSVSSNQTLFDIGHDGHNSLNQLHFDGQIAEVAVWDVALTDAEITALAAGWSPLFIRPASLKFYVPLTSNTNDVVGGLTATVTGTPALSSAHPAIIYPWSAGPTIPAASTAGGATILALTMSSTGIVPLPSISTQVFITVAGELFMATGGLPLPAVITAADISIAGELFSAVAALPLPSILTGLVIGGQPMSAAGALLVPGKGIGLPGVVMTATGALLIPVVQEATTISGELMSATGRFRNPTVNGAGGLGTTWVVMSDEMLRKLKTSQEGRGIVTPREVLEPSRA